MNEREHQICERIRQFRESTKWSQDDVSKELGISRDRWASVEYGRTPLRYDLAKRLADVLKRNFGRRLSLIDARNSMAWLDSTPGTPPGEAYERALRGVVKRTLEKLPVHLRFDLLQTILATTSKFAAQHKDEMAAFRRDPKPSPVASQRGRASAAARELNRKLGRKPYDR